MRNAKEVKEEDWYGTLGSRKGRGTGLGRSKS